MSEREKVGVRELRQNLSKYLRRVDAGETVVVIPHEHGGGPGAGAA